MLSSYETPSMCRCFPPPSPPPQVFTTLTSLLSPMSLSFLCLLRCSSGTGPCISFSEAVIHIPTGIRILMCQCEWSGAFRAAVGVDQPLNMCAVSSGESKSSFACSLSCCSISFNSAMETSLSPVPSGFCWTWGKYIFQTFRKAGRGESRNQHQPPSEKTSIPPVLGP